MGNLHRSQQFWTFTFPKNTADHLIIIREAVENSRLIIYQQKMTKYGFLISAYNFTKAGWLDVVSLEIYLSDKDSTNITIKATGGSTGFLPLSIPLAPLLNCVLCWWPFSDM